MVEPMRLPGIRVVGLGVRPEGADAAQLALEAARQLGWDASPLQPDWTKAFSADHPVTVLACDLVYANGVDDALEASSTARDEFLSVLALNRGASGRPLVTIVESRRGGQTTDSLFRFDHPTYSGNLLGGFLAGENQSLLLMQQAAMHHDPLLKLCVDLYGQALAEPSEDARYFRLWSVLETLAISRVKSGLPGTLMDGTPWPDDLTTEKAAPRVYRLIAETLFRGPWPYDETSLLDPAVDLFEGIQNWYARRNATAHYGKLVPGDAVQSKRGWYRKALATVPPKGVSRYLVANAAAGLRHRPKKGNGASGQPPRVLIAGGQRRAP